MKKYIYVGNLPNHSPKYLVDTMSDLSKLFNINFYFWQFLGTVWYFECSEPEEKLPKIFKSLFDVLFVVDQS